MISFKEKLFPRWLRDEIVALTRLGIWIVARIFVMFNVIQVVTIFAGHLGKNALAAAGLGRTFCNFTGLPISMGFVSACDTLLSQASGAGNYKRIGIIGQRVFSIIIILSLPTIALWINTEKILIALGQDPLVARLASQYTEWFFIAHFFLAISLIVSKYLTCQMIFKPSLYASILAEIVNVVCCYLFMFYFKFGVRGAALSLGMAYSSMCLFQLFYIYFALPQSESWQGWSWESLKRWKEIVYLGTPTMITLVVEYGSGEIGIFVIGTIGSKEQAIHIAAMALNRLFYCVSVGLGITVATRVGHLLGSGKPVQAKRAMIAIIVIEGAITLFLGILIISTRNVVGWIFTNDRSVLNGASKVFPIIALAQMVDGFTSVLCGVSRGAGLQKYGAVINFVAFICILLPCTFIFIYVAKLGVIGAWVALILGWTFQVIPLTVLLLKSDWNKLSEQAQERSIAKKTMPLDTKDNDHDDGKVSMKNSSQSKKEADLNYNNDGEDDMKEQSSLLDENFEKDESKKLSKIELVLTRLAFALPSIFILVAGICVRVYL